jgi:hypothetical protein
VVDQDCGLLAMLTLPIATQHQRLLLLTPAAQESQLLQQQRTPGSSCVFCQNEFKCIQWQWRQLALSVSFVHSR